MDIRSIGPENQPFHGNISLWPVLSIKIYRRTRLVEVGWPGRKPEFGGLRQRRPPDHREAIANGHTPHRLAGGQEFMWGMRQYGVSRPERADCL